MNPFECDDSEEMGGSEVRSTIIVSQNVTNSVQSNSIINKYGDHQELKPLKPPKPPKPPKVVEVLPTTNLESNNDTISSNPVIVSQVIINPKSMIDNDPTFSVCSDERISNSSQAVQSIASQNVLNLNESTLCLVNNDTLNPFDDEIPEIDNVNIEPIKIINFNQKAAIENENLDDISELTPKNDQEVLSKDDPSPVVNGLPPEKVCNNIIQNPFDEEDEDDEINPNQVINGLSPEKVCNNVIYNPFDVEDEDDKSKILKNPFAFDEDIDITKEQHPKQMSTSLIVEKLKSKSIVPNSSSPSKIPHILLKSQSKLCRTDKANHSITTTTRSKSIHSGSQIFHHHRMSQNDSDKNTSNQSNNKSYQYNTSTAMHSPSTLTNKLIQSKSLRLASTIQTNDLPSATSPRQHAMLIQSVSSSSSSPITFSTENSRSINARVVSWMPNIQDPKTGLKHTAFIISVEIHNIAQWTVQRSYQEFRQLYIALKDDIREVFSDNMPCPFPLDRAKNWVVGMNDNIRNCRKVALDGWLRSLLCDTHFMKRIHCKKSLKLFLNVDDIHCHI